MELFAVFISRRIIPHLVEGCAGERLFSNLELDYEHDSASKQHRVDPPSHARDVELKEQRAGQCLKLRLQKPDLVQPRRLLCRLVSQITVCCQPADYRLRMRTEKLGNRRTHPPTSRFCSTNRQSVTSSPL